MSRPPRASLSNAGIKKLSNGDSVIPSSTRADGSVRKEIRVKPGYKPPEDVEVYKNRTAEAWKNRGKAGVPGADSTTAEDDSRPQSAAALKNAKRREARKRAAAAGSEGDIEANVDGGENTATEKVADADPAAEQELSKAKEARKLAKKLRQARELQDKKNQGDSLLPEQLSKVIKINELMRQLDALGFDAEGEEKPSVTDKPD